MLYEVITGDVVGQQGEQFITHGFEYWATGRTGLLEGIQAQVVPALQGFLGRALQIGHMDFHHIALADAIQAADALLQQIRIEGQIEQHQMAGKLEVSTFGSDFGAA